MTTESPSTCELFPAFVTNKFFVRHSLDWRLLDFGPWRLCLKNTHSLLFNLFLLQNDLLCLWLFHSLEYLLGSNLSLRVNIFDSFFIIILVILSDNRWLTILYSNRMRLNYLSTFLLTFNFIDIFTVEYNLSIWLFLGHHSIVCVFDSLLCLLMSFSSLMDCLHF